MELDRQLNGNTSNKKSADSINKKEVLLNPPFVLLIMKKCITYGISHETMASVNYTDLIYLITLIETDKLKEMIEYKKQNDSRSGGAGNRNIITATPAQATNFFKGGGVIKNG